MDQIGEIIQHRRQQLGMSVEALASKIYVAPNTIRRWEDNRQQPDSISRQLLTRVLQLEVGSLITARKSGESGQGQSKEIMKRVYQILEIIMSSLAFIGRFLYLFIHRPGKDLLNIFISTVGWLIIVLCLRFMPISSFYINLVLLTAIYLALRLYFYYGNQ